MRFASTVYPFFCRLRKQPAEPVQGGAKNQSTGSGVLCGVTHEGPTGPPNTTQSVSPLLPSLAHKLYYPSVPASLPVSLYVSPLCVGSVEQPTVTFICVPIRPHILRRDQDLSRLFPPITWFFRGKHNSSSFLSLLLLQY